MKNVERTDRTESRTMSVISIDFNTSLAQVSEQHSVVPMATFMESLAPALWPEQERTSFCYSARSVLSSCYQSSDCDYH